MEMGLMGKMMRPSGGRLIECTFDLPLTCQRRWLLCGKDLDDDDWRAHNAICKEGKIGKKIGSNYDYLYS